MAFARSTKNIASKAGPDADAPLLLHKRHAFGGGGNALLTNEAISGLCVMALPGGKPGLSGENPGFAHRITFRAPRGFHCAWSGVSPRQGASSDAVAPPRGNKERVREGWQENGGRAQCLVDSPGAFLYPPALWRGGRVVEGAPLLRE